MSSCANVSLQRHKEYCTYCVSTELDLDGGADRDSGVGQVAPLGFTLSARLATDRPKAPS